MEVQLNRFFYPLLLFSYSLFAQVDYETQIQTIFNSNCTSCHIDGGAYYGGLDLSSYDSLMAGGNSGAVIVPSDHTNSYLWQRVNNGEMPPGNNPDLSSDEIDLIAQWIDEGALEIVGCADGEVELWDECYSIENTDSLDLNNSGLTGEIPPEIFDLTNLTYLNLGENQLTGSIPPEIGNMTSLIGMNLGNNQLTGEIPESICDLNISFSNSLYFNISNNQLCPPYPSCVEDHVGEQDTTNCEQVSIIDETLLITYNLHNAYPNPFNPVTTLRYDLPEDAIVNVTIYDMMGRHVNTIVSSQQSAGYKSIQWDAINSSGQPVSAGVYLYVIQAGEFRQTRKMVLLK